jgi:hypothetical protein
MGPLERRYRRLLRLLPAEHRARRGEELLGLLLDLDGQRDRPSVRQAAGVIGLALRLRLAGAVSLLLAAFLITIGTASTWFVFSLAAGNVVVSKGSLLRIVPFVVLPVAARLALAVAWLAGARRLALASAVGVLGGDLLAPGNTAAIVLDLPILVIVAVAVFRRWPAPRPRWALLAAIPLATAGWLLAMRWGADSIPTVVVAMTLSIAVAAELIGRLTRRSRSARDLRHVGVDDAPAGW